MELELLQQIWWQLYWVTVEKLIFNEAFDSYFYWYHQVKYLCNVLKIAKLNDPIFFPDCEIKYSWNLLSLRKNKTKCEAKKKKLFWLNLASKEQKIFVFYVVSVVSLAILVLGNDTIEVKDI